MKTSFHRIARIAGSAFLTVVLLMQSGCGGGDPTSQTGGDGTNASKQTAAAANGLASTYLKVVSLTKVSETRVGRTVFDYTFKVSVRNTGSSAYENVVLTLTAAGAGATVIDGRLALGSIAAGAELSPGDTVTIRQDRTLVFDAAALIWLIEGTALPANSDHALRIDSIALAASVVALDSASDGLLMTQPGVFISQGASKFQEGTVFLRDALAFKVSFVDPRPDGSTVIYTVTPALNEVYSDLKMSGWIDASTLTVKTIQRSAPISNRARILSFKTSTGDNCLTASTLPFDFDKFGFSFGFNNCELDSSPSVTFDGILKLVGKINIDRFDVGANTYLFTPTITITPSASLLLGGVIDKQFDEVILLSRTIPSTVPLNIDIGLQIGAAASGVLKVAVSDTFYYSPGQTGFLDGSVVTISNFTFTNTALTLDPISLGIDASVTIEPFVAIGVGPTIGPQGGGATIDLARFRFRSGLKVAAGAQLLSFGGDACGNFSVSPIAHADFAPAYFQIGSIHIFDTPYTFFSHEFDPIFSVRPSGCVYGPSAHIDILPPLASNDVSSAWFGQSGLTLSGASSASRDDDPIRSYSWSISGIDLLSGIRLDSTDSVQTRVTPNGIQPGQVATVQLTVNTLSGKEAVKQIRLLGNVKPTASGTITVIGNTATLDASASHDTDGRLVQWRWSLSDGRTIRQHVVGPINIDVSTVQRPIVATLTVTDDAGDTNSIAVTERLGQSPFIVSGPTDTPAQEGQTATFNVVARGSGPLAYQWRRNGVNVSCATGTNCPSYTTPATTLADNGAVYSVVVSNLAGTVASNSATLTVSSTVPAPTIASVTANPATPTVGTQATFSVNGTNLQPGYVFSLPGCAATEVSSSSTTLRQFTCVLVQSGTVQGTVRSSQGDVLHSFSVSVLERVPPVSGRQSVASGYSHSCALTPGGGVKCWGNNAFGQLGDRTTVGRVLPGIVSGLASGVVAISSGPSHTCALTAAGAVKCWGDNLNGYLGDGTNTMRTTPVDVAGLGSGVVAISASAAGACALTASGQAMCWGQLTGDGTFEKRLSPVSVVGLPPAIAAIASGFSASCALTAAGGVKCWGLNQFGAAGDGTTAERLVPVDVVGLASGVGAIANGDDAVCALLNSGGVKCWGLNAAGTLPIGTVSAVPVAVSGLTGTSAGISVGDTTGCAVSSAGGVKCWGSYNAQGELGDGTMVPKQSAVDVVGLDSGVVSISVGYIHTCVAMNDGSVRCWGRTTTGSWETVARSIA